MDEQKLPEQPGSPKKSLSYAIIPSDFSSDRYPGDLASEFSLQRLSQFSLKIGGKRYSTTEDLRLRDLGNNCPTQEPSLARTRALKNWKATIVAKNAASFRVTETTVVATSPLAKFFDVGAVIPLAKVGELYWNEIRDPHHRRGMDVSGELNKTGAKKI